MCIKDIEKRKKDLLEAYNRRHAAKSFDPDKKIPADDFNFILETARLSPSSFGLEHWNISVLQNPVIREKLKSVSWGAQGQLPSASHFVLFSVRRKEGLEPGSGFIRHMYIDIKNIPEEMLEGKKQKLESFQKNDFMIIDEDDYREWAARQAYIALGNMMTAAAFIGIDSCPIEGFHRGQAEQILAEEGIIDCSKFSLACMAAFGYRTVEPRPKTRRPAAEVITWHY